MYQFYKVEHKNTQMPTDVASSICFSMTAKESTFNPFGTNSVQKGRRGTRDQS